MNLQTETGSIHQDRRCGYRLRFASGRRPVIATAGFRMDVLDISEQGIRFAQHPDHDVVPDQFFAAVIEFPGKPCQTVFGSVVRVSPWEVAARLYKGPDLNLLVEERAAPMQ